MYTIAIVDDEIELRKGLESLFPWEKLGFQVIRSFGNGQDADKWIQNNPVDVVITDIRMPFMSGLDLIRSLKAHADGDILYCLLSAHKDFSYAHEGLELGVRHYLFKPTDFDEISSAFLKIREELDRRRADDQNFLSDDNVHNTPRIRNAFEIMKSSPGNTTLQSLARELGVNPSYLSRLFKEETGENFSNVLSRIRMEKAAVLLNSPRNYTNREIAEMVGYQDPQNFCRSFKQYYKLTPRQYRQTGIRMEGE